MADIGLKVSKRGKDATSPSAGDLQFNSSIFVDKITAGVIGGQLPHGLTYKPTLIGMRQAGFKDITSYVDNYNINAGFTNTKCITLSQEGT